MKIMISDVTARTETLDGTTMCFSNPKREKVEGVFKLV